MSSRINIAEIEELEITPAIVYLYGPPASGKLTVAEHLKELTGFSLFHNHLTVNAISSVFAFDSDAYNDVLHRLRLDVLATAARTNTGLIFTNNSAWGGSDGRTRFEEFVSQAKKVVVEQSGRIYFVQMNAPLAVLEERLANESRRAHHKLLDVNRLRELLVHLDQSPLHPDDLILDTSTVSPRAAALSILAALQ